MNIHSYMNISKYVHAFIYIYAYMHIWYISTRNIGISTKWSTPELIFSLIFSLFFSLFFPLIFWFFFSIFSLFSEVLLKHFPLDYNDDDVYLIEKSQHVGYKIYLHTNTDQPERHKYKMKSIRKMYSWLGIYNM
jgi:hypothetical protein